MALDFSGFGGAGNDPSVMGWGDTQDTDYSTAPLSSGLPANVVDTPRSDGITFDGILSGVSATADTLFNTFGKIYSLQSSVENAKFQRTVNAANLELKQAQTMGSIDIQRAAIDANLAIEKARAARATNDALTQVNSGSAGFIVQNGKISPLMILGGLALIGGLVYFRRGK
jgi:hypothetical protein